MESFDLVVIGSGPGGQRAAVQAAKLGKKVVIIEKEKIGGHCLHQGTIPSKTLREAAILTKYCTPETFISVMHRAKEVIEAEQEIIRMQLERNKILIKSGTARFTDSRTLEIVSTSKKEKVSGSVVVIATGTRPNRPSSVPFNDVSIVDSDTILNLKKLPKSLAVLGAGVIGCEYASVFARLGSKVTLFDQRSSILRAVDAEVLKQLEEQFKTNGVEIELGRKFGEIHALSDGAAFDYDGKTLKFDVLLYCLGRVGNVEALDLKVASINANERGVIAVNEHYQTNISHVYAVGDVQGAPGLATSAAEQGRMAAAHAFNHFSGKFPETFPYGIYTIPEISQVGPTEEELKEKKIEYIVGRAKYRELARGKILDDDDGLLKLIFEKKSRKLLAVHILGTGATELVHIGQTAIALGADIDFFVTNVFNYPTLAEAYKVAGYAAFNQVK